MKIYILVIERRSTESYQAFQEELTKNPNVKYWMHYFKSAYLIATEFTSRQLSELVISLLEKYGLRKRHLVLGVNLKDRYGLLPKEGWEWITRAASISD